MIKQENVLYIHGLGSDANSTTYKYLCELLPNHNIATDTFDLLNPIKTLEAINDIIDKKAISYVIGSSLGGFYALCCNTSICKIVVNPCMDPAVEIPKLTDVPDLALSEFAKLKESAYNDIDMEVRLFTYGIFGKNDELFSYRELFSKLYSCKNNVNVLQVDANHKLTKSQLEVPIEKGFEHFSNSQNWLKHHDKYCFGLSDLFDEN